MKYTLLRPIVANVNCVSGLVCNIARHGEALLMNLAALGDVRGHDPTIAQL